MNDDDVHSYEPERVYDAFLKTGEAWADQDAAAELLERTREVVLAELKTLEGDKTSDAAANRIALTKPAYREHLERMIEARRLANRLKARMNALVALHDARRTRESTRRKEMEFVQQGGAGT